MKTRVISGLVGLLMLLAVVIKGGIVLNLSVFIISIIALYEFSKVILLMNLKVFNLNNYGFAFLLLIIGITDKQNLIQPVIFIYLISTIILLVLKDNTNPVDIGINIFAGFYTVFLPFHVTLMNGSKLIWLIFIGAWASDTFAYFTGKKIGKRKLCPNLSPNKTIEGFIGGILGSLIITIIFVYYFDLGFYIQFAILSIISSISSVFGDLTASRIKRIVKIKDFGNIMPGHGGVLDRFDSILFTAPVVYYYITFVMNL